MKFIQYKFISPINNSETTTQTIESWATGSVFTSRGFPAYRMRIQAIPGIRFNINDSLSWCTIGYDGVYELDLGNSQPLIANLRFSKDSLENLPENMEILVEFFYEAGGGQ